MSKKANGLPTLSFSTTKPGRERQTPPKATMLHIKGIPDTNAIVMKRFDHEIGGFVYAHTGNLKLLNNELLADFNHNQVIFGGHKPDEPDDIKGDFAFNFICDPDQNSRALEAAASYVDTHKIPCLNHPDKVKQLTRDGLYQRFNGMDNIVIPKTLRITPRYCRDIQSMIEAGDIQLPIIVRPAGGHNGTDMLLLESLDDINQLEQFAFDGRDYYLIEYHDYRNDDGLFRKYRILWINGHLYARHLIIDTEWKIHGGSVERTMKENKALTQENIDYLENAEEVLGEQRSKQLKTLFSQTELDFCGMDFTLLPDNQLFVFEANPSMNTAMTTGHKYMPYLEKHLLQHEEAKIRMLQDAASLHSVSVNRQN